MANNYVQPGAVFNYENTSGSPVSSGDVVIAGSVIGVALNNIAAGATGSVQTEGVFVLPKNSSKADQGDELTWDVSAKKFGAGITPASGDISGAAVAFSSADAGDSTVQVKLTGAPGTVKE